MELYNARPVTVAVSANLYVVGGLEGLGGVRVGDENGVEVGVGIRVRVGVRI